MAAVDAIADNDRASVRRVLAGEPDAFERIVQQYQQRTFSILLMMVKDRQHAEDLTQDAFLRAYTHLSAYDLQKPFYPWLATIAVRLGLNWIERSPARSDSGTNPEPDRLASGISGPEQDLADGRVKDQLWQHVASLPPGERIALLLFYKQDLNVREIAEALGVTTGTVKTQLHRGRAHLKERLTQRGESR